MPAHYRPGIQHWTHLRYQQGQALLLLAVVLSVLLATAFQQLLAGSNLPQRKEAYNHRILEQARQALIAYAVAGVTPGLLPCPDRIIDRGGRAIPGNDGLFSTSPPSLESCGNAAGTTGQSWRLDRLPWKTLGLPELRDADGQLLWYAVSSNFKAATARTPVNSDTPGTILVRDSHGRIIQDPGNGSGAIAVVIAAGSNGLDHFSEGRVQESNADFIDGSRSNGFIQGPIRNAAGELLLDDQLLFIRHEDLLPKVEQRVAGIVLQQVLAYNRELQEALAQGALPGPYPLQQTPMPAHPGRVLPVGFEDISCQGNTRDLLCPIASSPAGCTDTSNPRTLLLDCPGSHPACAGQGSQTRIEIVCRSHPNVAASNVTCTDLGGTPKNCGPLTLTASHQACSNPTQRPFTVQACSARTLAFATPPRNCGRIPANFGAITQLAWTAMPANTRTNDRLDSSGWFQSNGWRELTLLAYPPGTLPGSNGCDSGTTTTLDVRRHRADEIQPGQTPPQSPEASRQAVAADTPLVLVAGRVLPSQRRTSAAERSTLTNYFEAPNHPSLPNPLYQQANASGPLWWTGKMLPGSFNDTLRWQAP